MATLMKDRALPARRNPDLIKDRANRSNPANPSVLGINLEENVLRAGGAFGAAFVNQQFLSGIVKSIVPGATAHSMIAKVIDAGTLGLSAVVIKKGLEIMDRRLSQLAFEGAAVLVGASLVTAVVPGMSLTATLPNFSFGGLLGHAAPALTTSTAALAASTPSHALSAGAQPGPVGPTPNYGQVPSMYDWGL